MGYAEVCVNAPLAQRRTFTYSIPPYLDIQPGQAVWVPFGSRQLQGIVIALSETTVVEQTRDITSIIDLYPVLTEKQITLALWISDYYLVPLFDAIALMLPPGFERRVRTLLEMAKPNNQSTNLNETQQHIIRLLSQNGRVSLNDLEKTIGKQKVTSSVSSLLKLGIISRSFELAPINVKIKQVPYLSLNVPKLHAIELVNRISKQRFKKQTALLNYLLDQTVPVPVTEASMKTGCNASVIRNLVKAGIIRLEQVCVRREPKELKNYIRTEPRTLSPAQQDVFQPIIDNLKRNHEHKNVFLLHGVTGSGKTEIYLQALTETLNNGKRGIVLVPEISMTPQTIERFVGRFPNRVAILHSKLTPGEQFDEWHRIKQGKVDVVIGPRSAIFAPLPDTGLIVIDEEHEWTYKQSDSPRYHTRSIAIKMNEIHGCTVILGSATPDVETYYQSRTGKITLLNLPERVVPLINSPLPKVVIVDMRQELKENNRSIFSRALSLAIKNTLLKQQQVILFLNRRGMSSFVQCRNCGFSVKCHRCDSGMTYHLDTNLLLCHHCGYRQPVPEFCPRCFSRRIRFLGIGTEKLEEEVGRFFPSARILRWDSDVTRRKNEHRNILDRFRNHQADILIGTQMIAKGLDLPLVTLVGIINADLNLNLPDFRAGERTFQLLSQVAGRAGRGQVEGNVIIQTYNPDHYAIKAAAQHNYTLFYEQEITYRRQLNYPPFTQLARLIFSHTNEQICEEIVRRRGQQIITKRDSLGLTGLELIGPAPAYIHRLRGKYRWQIIIRGHDLSSFLIQFSHGQGWSIDIDPIGT